MTEESRLDDFPIDGVVKAVMDRLQQKDADSDKDLYVWDDGSVSNQKTTATEDLRIVSLFTPTGELPSEAEVRESIENGVRAIRERHGSDTGDEGPQIQPAGHTPAGG
jgi:hypothetical protein